MSKSQIKKWLRNEPTEDVENENEDITNNQASVVEKELEHVLEKKSSVFEKPHLEKFGQNDFLVMDTELEDKFVTVIPNAIFYNVEKKCVNWLDDCSLQGIRDRLLRGVKSP
ncbi:4-aminobutyraldehyde dehydrogenase [Operophtera brumata]|uniref:4-aminobutyraldehyde dehydrogenase n=1 Tax=Operophtera brumata TaxID=104452 RepID=A0A0L7LM28_OPEBR|nr:4-aminobutyraldehyde dehydrogenase [Operophtera brumata]